MPATKVTADAPPQQGEYKGEPLDDELANGPMTKRTCRDPICCLLFVAFLGGMIGVAIYGYTQGNPSLIGRGYDVEGHLCGITSGYTDYPYVYFPIPFSGYLTTTVCVKTCPSSYSTTPVYCGSTKTSKTSLTYFCNVGGSETPDNTDQTGLETAAATYSAGAGTGTDFYTYPTTGFASRYCIPSVTTTALSSVTSFFDSSDSLENWISDIRESWQVILVSIGVAFAIGFAYMIFLRYCSGVLTWLAIVSFIAGMGILGWRFYNTATTTSANSTTVSTEKAFAYACWAVAGVAALGTLCLFNRIRLAIAILKAAADYVKDTPSIFLVPIVIGVILGGFFAFWAAAGVYLISSGDATRYSDSAFGTFTYDKTLQRLLIYHLFGLLWFNAFVIASTQFILASSTALWYFSQGTGQEAPKSIRTSVKRLFRYHFGSIAFGSLILAIVQMIRIILAYMETQAKKMAGKESKIVQYTLKCLQCYLACFERFIKFLNKNAYIQIALSGKSFCGAAKDAFFLILRNPLRMGVVTSIGGIFVLFGKIFIAALTALGAYLVLDNWSYFSEKIYTPLIPTIIIFVIAYAIGAIFMTVYGLASDTILACFIVDEELNKKKNAPPRHCPASLRSFLDEHKKK